MLKNAFIFHTWSNSTRDKPLSLPLCVCTTLSAKSFLKPALPQEALSAILPLGCDQDKLAGVALFETWLLYLQVKKAEGNRGPWSA